MIDLDPPYRHAKPEDAAALAELVDIAGEGLPLHLWARMAEPGESPWDVGRRRAGRDDGGFSYRNAVVVEAGDAVVACLIGYPLAETPEPIDRERMPAILVPLQELEDLAPGTWYVNVLACTPEHRGQGHGTGLLALAERIAAASGRSGLSIIVSDANRRARRLYRRCGYRQAAERRMVKEDWKNPGETWVLLTKTV